MSEFLKPNKIASTALGILRRERVLAGLVWRDAAGDFAGAEGDTISIRVPGYTKARKRALRSGATRIRDGLVEQKVDVSLDTDIYKDIPISDEELTLDIANFGEQVLNPLMEGVVDTIEDEIVDTMESGSYAQSVAYSYASDDAWDDLIVPARELLNNARVPVGGRVLAVGSGVESEMLRTDLFKKADESGTTQAVAEATLGRKGGFTIVSVPSLDPDEAYAFHRTAYVLNNRAPVVPAGAPYGTTQSHDGHAIRIVRVLDSNEIRDILALDSWIGTNLVRDAGYFGSDGKFVPAEAKPGDAVTLSTSAASDDIIDATGHGFEVGERVVFSSLTGGTGLSVNRDYYVIAANHAADTFQVAATPGGAAVNFSADITAGTVRSAGNELLVRAVKVTAS